MTYQRAIQSQNIELLVAYRKQPSVNLRNRLVCLNIGLVYRIANRMAHQCTEPYEDLTQSGCIGLITAIERFDISKGHTFSTFAFPYIRGEILHFLRDRANSIRIPRAYQDLNRKAQKVQQTLSREQGCQPSDQEMINELGISMSEWGAMKLAVSNRYPLSLNAVVASNYSQNSDARLTLGDTVIDLRDQIQRIHEEERYELQQALTQLEDKTQELITLVFLEQLSQRDVAQRIGVSANTVSRRLKKALEKLSEQLQPYPVPLG